MRILVTGAAGFIGSALSLSLCKRGDEVLGIDNLSTYYDVGLKRARLQRLEKFKSFSFHLLDIALKDKVNDFFGANRPVRVVHLAAQAGVRYSLENPHCYIDSNIQGFMNILEACRHHPVEHLVYASSSSVYGANRKVPFSIHDNVDHPVSLYAATKKANELMAHCYSHLYRIPTTGLRFFTVYGPWGRPDMAFFLFTKALLADQPIDLFNFGKHRRDFTYIDDIVEGVTRVLDKPATPYRIYNIGNGSPVWVEELIGTLEQALGKKAKRNLLAMQPGDVLETYADIQELERDFGFRPQVSIEEGTRRFVEWYRSFYPS